MRNPIKRAASVALAVILLIFILAAASIFAPRKAKAVEVLIPRSSFASLQPFKSFPKGAGEGVAYEYKSRTKAQFVALLRDKKLAKKEMRVTCDVLIRQMVEARKMLPFEGCEGAAAAIEHDNDYSVDACRDAMFQQENWLTVTNDNGSAWGVWHRACLKDEQVLVYKGQPIISLTCLNVVIPVSPQTPPSVAPPPAEKKTPPAKPRALSPPDRTIASCPAVNFLKINVWPPGAFKLPGVRQTHAKEELGQKQFAGVPHVSKTHGDQFRRACADGVVCQSEKPHAFRVSLIMTPEARGIQDSQITKEEILGDIIVTGVYDALQFTRAQLEEWDAIRLVAIDDDVTSPPRYLATGVHELRFFNRLPGKTLGEWDENPVPDCIMNEHWIE